MKHILKVWSAGTGTLVTTIPKIEKTLNNIKANDLVEISIKKINQNQNKSKKDLIIDNTKE